MAFFRDVEPKLIGVFPAAECGARRKLFAALAEAHPVRFDGRQPGDWAGLDAALLLPGSDQDLDVELDVALPRFVAVAEEEPVEPIQPFGVATGPRLDLTAIRPLDRRLHGARLRDATVERTPALIVAAGDAVFASRGKDVLWLSRPSAGDQLDLVAVAPAELDDRECLRDRLRNGRFLAVAALTHFLRAVCADVGWRPPPLRASFLFDDPNLHWTSYGHLRYQDLAREADRHHYHVAFATVPLDGWYAHPAASRLFREHPDRLSLVVHGNTHARLELGRADSAPGAYALLSQALARIAAFERRSAVPVARIMVAPYGVCSRALARWLVPLGFEALCITRPYPWLAEPPRSWLARPAGASALTGWHPANVVENGLPVLLRRPFDDAIEDLTLRAYLDQPLIIYGHHWDVANGLDRLQELADLVNRLGDVEWKSPGAIATSNVMTRHDGGTLRVRMFARRAVLAVPRGTERIAAELASLEPQARRETIAWRADSVPDGDRSVELSLTSTEQAPVASAQAPAMPKWASARRLMSEGRDRLAPVYARLR